MSNFDTIVDRRTNGQTNGKADAYVAQTDERTNGQMNGKVGTYVAKSGGQGDVSCKV